MTELTIQEHRARHAATLLTNEVKHFCEGRPCDNATINAIEDLIKRHRAAACLHGIDFPEMVVMPFPRLGAVEIVRRDLDEKAIQTIVLNVTVKYPMVTAHELAAAVRYAFPGYRVGNLSFDHRVLRKKN